MTCSGLGLRTEGVPAQSLKAYSDLRPFGARIGLSGDSEWNRAAGSLVFCARASRSPAYRIDCDGTSGAAALFVSHDIRDIVERDDGVFSSSSSGHHPHPFMKERFFRLLTIEAE